MSIFKKVKKGFKRLGSSIAKRMRKIGRGVKKGFKKLTKAFGKLGPLGHIALFFILPGMGNVLSSWMGQFGSKVMSMLPKNFSSILGRVGTAVKDAASWAYNNTVGKVYNTVGDALTSGIDYVTKPFFSDGVGAATRFKNFVSDTAAKFSAPEQTLTPEQVTEQAKESFSDLEKTIDSGAELPAGRTEQLRQEQIKQKQITAERKAASQKVLDDTKPDTTVTTGAKDVADAAKPDKESLYDRYVSMKEGVADRPIPGTGVTIGEAASVSKDATLVYGTYQYFNPDEVSGEFYNPNVGLANALNTPNDPYTMSSQASSFVPVGQANQTLFDAGKIYANAMGMTGPDPILESLNAPGYGFSFEDYITGRGVYG